jgi:ankyrin repeat protein
MPCSTPPRGGDTELLRSYLNAGAPATLTNAAGDSLLMLAAYHGHEDAVQLILHHGADVNAANDRGQTPLAGAVFKGYTGVARVAAGRRCRPRRRNPLSARRCPCSPGQRYWPSWASISGSARQQQPDES